MLLSTMRQCGALARDRKGNVAILFGLALLPIALAIGIAADYGRAIAVRSRMVDAADSAALAVGSWQNLTEAQMKQKARQYFDANHSSTQLGAIGKIDVLPSGDDIVVKVTGTVPTSFLQLANISSIDVGAETVVTRRQRNIELALVLDTTGSMGSSGKMTAMQTAAKKMVDNLFGQGNTSDTLKVSVVPFSGAVNVGEQRKTENWIDKNAKSEVSYEDFKKDVKVFDLIDDMKSEKWSGCVRERVGDAYELTDYAPSTGTAASLFAPYFAPDEPDSDHDDGYRYTNSYIDDGNCGTKKKSKRTPQKCQKYTGKYKNAQVYSSSKGPDINCPPRPITPLTNTKSTVTSAINALQPKGYTVIPAGLLWGWRVLSPGKPFTEGKPYDSEKWIKAIVLLTDGENNVGGGTYNHNKSYYNAFGYAAKGHLGSKNGSKAEKELNAKTKTVCNNIKAQGIVIYTIGFKVYDKTTQTLLKNCATEPDMYYNSPSNSQLSAIFKDIAQGLSELRIAQ